MKRIRENRGAAAVEFAVLFLLLMIIVFGIIEFGFIWLQTHYIANAAREGARVAATGQEQDQIERTVKEYLKDLPFYADKVADCCGEGKFVRVEITPKDPNGKYALKIPVPDTDEEDWPRRVEVTVTVRSSDVWEPILWDLLELLPHHPNPDPGNSSEYYIKEFAVFAVEP